MMECNKKAEPKNDLYYRLKSSEFCTDFWHIFWCLSLLSGIELATNVSFSEKVAVNISTVVQEFLHSITIRFQHVVGILLATTLSRILTAGKIFPYLLSFRVLWELFNNKNTFQFYCLFSTVMHLFLFKNWPKTNEGKFGSALRALKSPNEIVTKMQNVIKKPSSRWFFPAVKWR